MSTFQSELESKSLKYSLNVDLVKGGRWTCHHIDDLHPSSDRLPSLAALQAHSVSSLFEEAVKHAERDSDRRLDDIEEEDMEVVEMKEPEYEFMNIDDDDISTTRAAETGEPIDSDVSVLKTKKEQAQRGLDFARRTIIGADGGEMGAVSEVLDVDGIIEKCVHAALVMLRDDEEHRQRKTLRLELLLYLLHQKARPGKCCMFYLIILLKLINEYFHSSRRER